MKTLSTGQPSTFSTYRRLCVDTFGEESETAQFFDKKIKAQGDMEVLSDEAEIWMMIARLEQVTLN